MLVSLPLRHPLSSSSSYPIAPLPIASSSIVVAPRRAVARGAVAIVVVARLAVAIVVVGCCQRVSGLTPMRAERSKRRSPPCRRHRRQARRKLRRRPPLPAPPPASTCRSPPCRRHRRQARSTSQCVSGPTPPRCPPLQAPPPASAQRELTRQRPGPDASRAKQRRCPREPTRQRPDPAPLPPPAGAATGERAAIVFGSTSHNRAASRLSPTRQRPGPDASQAKQRGCPPPAGASAAPPPPLEHLRCCALPFFVWKLGRGGKLFGEAGSWYIFFDNGTNTTLRM